MNRSAGRGRAAPSEYIVPFVVPVVVLAAWEIAVRAGILEPLFFPPPTLIIQTFSKLIGNGELLSNLYPTLGRIFGGLALGTVPGLMLGLAMGWSRRVRLVFDPIVAALYPVPKIANLPLVMLVLGIGEISKLAIIGIGTFFLMSINAMAGVRNIDRVYFEVAANNNAGRLKVFTRVVVPGSLPMIFAGVRLALGMALLLVVAVEFNTARRGIGAMIWLAWQTLRTEQLYVGVIVCAVLGIVFSTVLKRIERHFMPWEDSLLSQP